MHAAIVASRYALPNVLGVVLIIALLLGGIWIWAAYVLIMFGMNLLDEAIGGETDRLPRAAKWFCEANLYATLPLLVVITVVFLHHVIKTDPIGMIHALSLIGIDFKSARLLQNQSEIVAATLGTAYLYGSAGVTVGHELIHRTTSPVALVVGRALLAFAFNTGFSIAHVYGHHRKVATYDDYASSRRGEYILSFAIRSIIGTNIEAFKIEAERLRRKGLPALSWQNRAIRGHLYSIAIVIGAAAIGGVAGIVAFLAAALIGLLLEKFLEYIQHYGLVRIPGAPIEARHSWDCSRIVSNALNYNLALHSDHHLAGSKPFWELTPKAGAPVLPCGYQTAVFIACVPPLWHRMIDPLIADWDRRMASEEERALIRRLGWELPQFAQHDGLAAARPAGRPD